MPIKVLLPKVAPVEVSASVDLLVIEAHRHFDQESGDRPHTLQHQSTERTHQTSTKSYASLLALLLTVKLQKILTLLAGAMLIYIEL